MAPRLRHSTAPSCAVSPAAARARLINGSHPPSGHLGGRICAWRRRDAGYRQSTKGCDHGSSLIQFVGRQQGGPRAQSGRALISADRSAVLSRVRKLWTATWGMASARPPRFHRARRGSLACEAAGGDFWVKKKKGRKGHSKKGSRRRVIDRFANSVRCGFRQLRDFSGGPCATIVPPAAPPAGRERATQSAHESLRDVPR